MPVVQLSNANPDGAVLGQSATDKVGFWGTTPVIRSAITNVTAGSTLPDVIVTLTALVVALKANGMVT
jgi:hypothetical protein